MTIFLIFAAVLTLATIAALVPALLKKQEAIVSDRDRQNLAIAKERLAELKGEHETGNLTDEAYAQAKAEFESSLADDLGSEDTPAEGASAGGRWMLGAVALSFPVVAAAIYLQLGAPEHMRVAGGGAGQQVAAHGGADAELPSVEEMAVALETKLQEEPQNAEGWYLLGRTYMSMQRYEDAVTAFTKVYEMVPDQPAVLISLADATAMTQAGRISGAPAELVAKALAISPDNVTALWLAGKAEAEAGNHAEAVKYWRRVEAMSEDDPQTQAEMRSQIAAAEKAGGLTPASATETAAAAPQETPVAAPQEAAPEPVASAGPAIRVNVTLDPSVATQVGASDTVFIYARALQGPPMPLAVARHQVSDLPLSVTLTDEMAMMPQMKLSNFPSVRVSARVSRSGDAMTRSGDLVSEDARIEVADNAPVSLVIDRAVP